MTASVLGRAVHDEWALDWRWLHVNHGSFGAAPRIVLEAEPCAFVFRVLPEALRAAAESLGDFVNAEDTDICLCRECYYRLQCRAAFAALGCRG